jgi:hypothetical protein
MDTAVAAVKLLLNKLISFMILSDLSRGLFMLDGDLIFMRFQGEIDIVQFCDKIIFSLK